MLTMTAPPPRNDDGAQPDASTGYTARLERVESLPLDERVAELNAIHAELTAVLRHASH